LRVTKLARISRLNAENEPTPPPAERVGRFHQHHKPTSNGGGRLATHCAWVYICLHSLQPPLIRESRAGAREQARRRLLLLLLHRQPSLRSLSFRADNKKRSLLVRGGAGSSRLERSITVDGGGCKMHPTAFWAISSSAVNAFAHAAGELDYAAAPQRDPLCCGGSRSRRLHLLLFMKYPCLARASSASSGSALVCESYAASGLGEGGPCRVSARSVCLGETPFVWLVLRSRSRLASFVINHLSRRRRAVVFVVELISPSTTKLKYCYQQLVSTTRNSR
jgi:hypothetical protein